MKRWLLALLVALWAPGAFGHSLSASYLTVNAAAGRSQLAGRWEIALADLQTLIDLDTDADGAVTWREVNAQVERIAAATLPGLDLRLADHRCPASVQSLLLNERSDGYYAVLGFVAPCAARSGELEVAERLFFERDRTHRTVLAVQHGALHTAAILTPDAPLWRAAVARR